MNRTNAFSCVILMSLTLLGCAATQRLATPSGRPEVTVNTTDKGIVKSMIIDEFMNSDFTLISETDHSVTFSKPAKGVFGFAYQALLGGADASTPEWQVTINMATSDASTRLMARAVIRMQNVYGREDVNDMTDGKKVAPQLQKMLEQVKSKVES